MNATHIHYPGLPFPEYLGGLQSIISGAFRNYPSSDFPSGKRGFPPALLKEIMSARPFAVAIPEAYGGRGSRIHETLAVLSAASYESLALSLTFGINMGLFLQPVAKYAREDVKGPLFRRFLEEKHMGGLMITEPDFGSDALNMRTSFTEENGHYHLRGKKHWAGLTGMAEYWLLTARRKSNSGELQRDIDFFICDNTLHTQKIIVEEYFDNLGLYFIPYGLNHLDVVIPKSHRLEPPETGVMMMLDLLHRSRLQFPGMAMGFIHRILDEALDHCRQRTVGGKSLLHYDQVQERISRLQGSFAVCSAMCAYSSRVAGLENKLTQLSVEANSVKTVITDLMQEAAQSLVQLVGAKAYKLSHVAGRGIVDSRPFQIFEGSNDILYNQIAENILKQMRRQKTDHFYAFLQAYPPTRRASDFLRKELDFHLPETLPQRKMVDLGRILARLVSTEMVLELGDKGFNKDLCESGTSLLHKDILQHLGAYTFTKTPGVLEMDKTDSRWILYSQNHTEQSSL